MQIKLQLSLPKFVKNDKIVLQFCFEDKEGKFGQSLIGIIYVVNHSSLETYEEKQREIANEMSDPKLAEGAVKLQDEGYGTYNRCLKILHAYQGDAEEAKKVLSQITMNDFNG